MAPVTSHSSRMRREDEKQEVNFKNFIDTFKLHGWVSVRKRHESVRVYDAFVEDESVSFSPCDDFEMFGGWVSVEEVGVDDMDVASFTVLERLFEFVE